MPKPTIYTIGHSDHSLATFIDLLKTNGVRRVVDVRSLTGSDRYPWFNEDRLGPSLKKEGIDYRILKKLSGRRPRQYQVKAHVDGWWDNQSFHNYADYALSRSFGVGLHQLERLAARRPTTTMCSEAVWWRCHRRIITDHLLAAGYPVENIMDSNTTDKATISPGAVVHRDGSVTYPGPHGSTTEAPSAQTKDWRGFTNVANGLLSTAELERVTGYRGSRLERCLRRAGVRYFPGKEGPWTTIDLINAAGGMVTVTGSDEAYPPDLRPVACP